MTYVDLKINFLKTITIDRLVYQRKRFRHYEKVQCSETLKKVDVVFVYDSLPNL